MQPSRPKRIDQKRHEKKLNDKENKMSQKIETQMTILANDDGNTGYGGMGDFGLLKAAYLPQEHHANLKQNKQQAHVARD
jgi:hypothetical protein